MVSILPCMFLSLLLPNWRKRRKTAVSISCKPSPTPVPSRHSPFSLLVVFGHQREAAPFHRFAHVETSYHPFHVPFIERREKDAERQSIKSGFGERQRELPSINVQKNYASIKKNLTKYLFLSEKYYICIVFNNKKKQIIVWQHCTQHISSSFIFTFTLAIKWSGSLYVYVNDEWINAI